MQKKTLLYSGKAKSLYESDEPGVLIEQFRDDTTAFDGAKHEKLANKGAVNHQISTHIMQLLMAEGVPTHFIKSLNDTESAIMRLTMIPLECVVRNIAAGSLCRRLGIESGRPLSPPLFELFLKNDALHDPMVNENHVLSFGWANAQQLADMKKWTLKINEILTKTFADAGLILVDAKYEFGVDAEGKIRLGDEISPDSCRIWDAKTHEKLDKDRFRQDLGDVVASYQKIAQRLGLLCHY